MRERIPGIIAITLVTVTTALWVFWGTAEMYYEGWGNPFPAPLAYMIPGAISLVLALLAVTWPMLGGVALIVVGSAFTFWWVSLWLSRGGDSVVALLSMFPVSGMLVITGVFFILESRYRRRRAAAGWVSPSAWVRRNFRYVVVLGAPMLVFLAVSAFNLPNVLMRVDDGDRSARVIEGNGVALMWAPEGPGWNWRQPWGGFPAWDSIALYGVEPIGIDVGKPGYDDVDKHAAPHDMATMSVCAFLSEDGTTLTDLPQNIWRMPTVDEIVRSLPKRNENAGCEWSGTEGQVSCRVQPDKETPLWAPDQPPVYMWAADESTADQAYYVSYNGWVRDQPKQWGNPRHGYRCVREVSGVTET